MPWDFIFKYRSFQFLKENSSSISVIMNVLAEQVKNDFNGVSSGKGLSLGVNRIFYYVKRGGL